MKAPLHRADRFVSDAGCCQIERFHFRGPAAAHEPIGLGLFSGIHGDEPAGPEALRVFLAALEADPTLATGYDLWVYPEINPVGCRRGTRENGRGYDLNRHFWRDSAEPEVRLIEEELAERKFDGIITLHADDTCEGHYGYSHGRTMEDALLRPALVAAERVLPRDRRSSIDGFAAREGIITNCYSGILAPPPEQSPRPFNLIFETPACAPLAVQVAAHVAALEAILATYRGFISYGLGL